ncbi:MAG: ABC transporter substrate-binding protein [Acidipila sp.]|nr:ABC transporter substrate-binding protein [Acidipila sp.]
MQTERGLTIKKREKLRLEAGATRSGPSGGAAGGGRQRIVSLAPSVTSILFAIGAGRQVVGVTKWCADVARVGNLPRLGDCWALDVGAVAKLRPTMIIGSVPFKTETVQQVLGLGTPFVAMNPRSLADVYEDIRLLGKITGRNGAAEKQVARMRAALANISRRTRRWKARPLVYCEAWPHPRISSPRWVSELVEIAGGEPIFSGGQKVSDEEVARAMPEVIVLAWTATGERAEPKKALENLKWQDVPAVRNRRVFVIRDELLNTPAPVLVEGAQELLRVMQRVIDQSSQVRATRAPAR